MIRTAAPRRLLGVVASLFAGASLSQGSLYFGGKHEVALEIRTGMGGGLFNQHCKLLSFLTLVTHMKPDRVALTGATKRDAFLAYTPDMKWSQVPLGSLWDEESISELLAGLETAHLLPSDINLPVHVDFVHLLSPKTLHRAQHCLDAISAHAHFLSHAVLSPALLQSVWTITLMMHAEYGTEYVTPDDSGEQICRIDGLPSLFRRLLQPLDAIRLWKQHISERVTQDMLTSGKCSRIIQHVEDTFLGLETKQSWRYPEVALRVKFNRTISMLADQVAEAVQRKSGDTFYTGVHLRIEPDATGWYAGDAYHERDNLLRHFKEVVYNFDADNTVYIAGAFNESIEAEMGSFLERRIITKRMILGEELLSDFHSEQLALLDFLVLSKAQYYAGFVASSMSYFCQEYRVLLGHDRLTSYLIDIQRDWYDFKDALAVQNDK